MAEVLVNEAKLKEVSVDSILRNLQEGKPIDYDHVLINGNLDISKLDLARENGKLLIKSEIKITKSQINGIINFSEAIFLERINFEESAFAETATFSGARFAKPANFFGAKFNKRANFRGTEFNLYQMTEQTRCADFRESSFVEADFSNAWFRGLVSFSSGYTQFKDYVWFNNCKFDGTANFAEANFNNAYFNGAEFRGNAIFPISTFSEVHFEQSLFNEDADFTEAHFGKIANFKGSKLRGDALLNGVVFDKVGALELERSRFNNFYARWNEINNALTYNNETYLYLVENYKRFGWFEDADNCYYSYRINYHINNPIRRLFDLAARFSYGYGLKPERPLAFSAFIIIFCGIIFFYSINGSLTPITQTISLGSALFVSANTFTSGASSLINASSATLSTAGNLVYMVTLEKILGWVFFVLFLASIGRTVIR
jgi:uncharacterized protein YjbI with pentapeptide repeats